METTMYEELKNEYFIFKAKKEQLNREIEKLESARSEIELVMYEIYSILTNYETHVFEDFIENKGE